MAAPSLEAARYRACAPRRACIRSAHVLMAAPYRACIRSAHLLMAAPYRACIRSAHVLMAAPYRACIRSAAGTASSISKMANLQSPPLQGGDSLSQRAQRERDIPETSFQMRVKLRLTATSSVL